VYDHDLHARDSGCTVPNPRSHPDFCPSIGQTIMSLRQAPKHQATAQPGIHEARRKQSRGLEEWWGGGGQCTTLGGVRKRGALCRGKKKPKKGGMSRAGAHLFGRVLGCFDMSLARAPPKTQPADSNNAAANRRKGMHTAHADYTTGRAT
jgi:hypothetical protein